MSDTSQTQEAVERWRQGKINIFDEMAGLERERDEALTKVQRQAERIRYLEGATNHACGTPLTQWRECAEMLAFAVRLESQQTQMNWRAFAQDGLAEFERLRGER
jgi:hypothetical protein